MKNMLITSFIFLLLLFFSIETIYNAPLIMDTVKKGFILWKNNIVPSLFPFFILSEFFIYFKVADILSIIFKPIMNKVFKMRGICAFILIMSIISGCPNNAKIINNFYEQGKIDAKEAMKILLFTQFSSPLFILGTVSILFLRQKNIGIILLLSHYLGNLIIGLLIRNYHPKIDYNKSSFKNIYKQINSEKCNFGLFFSQTIQRTVQTLLLILGTITTFLIFTTVINNHLHIPNIYKGFISGLFELTQGLQIIGESSETLLLKTIMSSFLLSFGGLSIHMQIFSILNEKVKYLPFLLVRILHASLSSIITYILFNILV